MAETSTLKKLIATAAAENLAELQTATVPFDIRTPIELNTFTVSLGPWLNLMTDNPAAEIMPVTSPVAFSSTTPVTVKISNLPLPTMHHPSTSRILQRITEIRRSPHIYDVSEPNNQDTKDYYLYPMISMTILAIAFLLCTIVLLTFYFKRTWKKSLHTQKTYLEPQPRRELAASQSEHETTPQSIATLSSSSALHSFQTISPPQRPDNQTEIISPNYYSHSTGSSISNRNIMMYSTYSANNHTFSSVSSTPFEFDSV